MAEHQGAQHSGDGFQKPINREPLTPEEEALNAEMVRQREIGGAVYEALTSGKSEEVVLEMIMDRYDLTPLVAQTYLSEQLDRISRGQ